MASIVAIVAARVVVAIAVPFFLQGFCEFERKFRRRVFRTAGLAFLSRSFVDVRLHLVTRVFALARALVGSTWRTDYEQI